MESFTPEKQSSDETAIISEARETVAVLADIRRKAAELRLALLVLPGDEKDETQRVAIETARKEASGETTVEKEMATRELSENETVHKERANLFAATAPGYSAYLLGRIAKLKQSIGLSFDAEYAQASALVTSAGAPRRSDDLLSAAQLLGIARRKAQARTIPPAPELARLFAAEGNDALRNIALVLSEKDREAFLSALPEDKRRTASALMDRKLSFVLKKPSVEDDVQHKIVQKRVESELAVIISGREPSLDNGLVKLLSGTLSELGEPEAKVILKVAASESLAQSATGERREMAYAARLVRTLAETDAFAGSDSAIRFMGQEKLHPRYFKYFRDYLQTKGLLAKSVDAAGDYWNETKCKKLYEFLKEKEQPWNDEGNVNTPFERGAAVFGFKKMLAYVGRPDVTPHDALFAFDSIMKLREASGLSTREFYANVLTQVRMDSSAYESGTAYHELNQLAQSLDISPSRLAVMRDKAQRYSDIDRLRGLSEYFTDAKKIVSSWNSVKKFSDLARLLKRTEILDELKELKTEAVFSPPKQKLYSFIEILAFHEDSKVDMNSVLEFWREPEKFFARGDAQIDNNPRLKALHDAIHPGNYAEHIQFLDLSAEEVRDALVSGALDRLQSLPPMEIIYRAEERSKNVYTELGFHDTVRLHIGSRSAGTSNPRLFHEVKKLMREAGLDIIEYLQGKSDAFEHLSGSDQKILREKIQEAIALYPNKQLQERKRIPSLRYRARVNYKSDPQAVLAGNDTSCCMPFGSGKNNNYMWNPACALFTLEEERGNKWRTVAQSMLTIDADLGKEASIPRVMQSNDMNEIVADLPETVLSQRRTLACDNIELAPNAKGDAEIIKTLYTDFFSKYIQYYNQKSQDSATLDEARVIIGQGNSDIRFGIQEKNTYLPTALIGYSDNMGESVDVIRFTERAESGRFTEESVKRIEGETPTAVNSGVLPLFSSDIVSAGKIEAKAYPESMREGLIRMQNYIIASEINSEIKNRPHLSLKYIDGKGMMRGYLIAYEGVREDEPVVYMEDIAADPLSRLSGGRLLNKFMEVYKKQYLDTGVRMPIFLQAREETSYALLKSQAESIAKKLGTRFTLEKVDEYQRGGSTMHALLIRPKAK